MLIVRTIRIDGQKVTITQSVDTGKGNGLSSETTVAAKEELALAVGLGATHTAPLEILRSVTPASGGQQERPGDGGQQERPGDGGQQERPGDGGHVRIWLLHTGVERGKRLTPIAVETTDGK